MLKASDTSYWRGFQPDDSVDGADKKNVSEFLRLVMIAFDG